MKTRNLLLVLVAVGVLGTSGYVWHKRRSAGETGAAESTAGKGGGPAGRRGGQAGNSRPIPVRAAQVKQGDVQITVDGLGTVTARNTATVKARVDGPLLRIAFAEGQSVNSGDLLAEIDPRPFQVQLSQALGQLARDQALLASAQVDLARYEGLLAKDSIAKQQVDTQAALVKQYQGTVQVDQAQVDNARLQLGYTRVTAPISGRLGLRQVDVGNTVHASDATGIVLITQTQPIAVVFPLPADKLGSVLNRQRSGALLQVEALDRDGKTVLARGRLVSADNQIDLTTGTVKLKAEFDNKDNALFPNQFVNARLHVETRPNAILVPVAAVQRGTQGSFVYVVNAEGVVTVRPVALSPAGSSSEFLVVDKGVQAGEQVVIDGLDKLRDGGKVELIKGDPAAAAASGPRQGRQGKRPRPADAA
ncbi:MAG: MdtA/MuxA family multidrug efflux RND transporter periplasmic adaptor subunit [Rubrivivax sp.]|nr:MAG: MdtA/MuxA family multidrug efflux RND transporter periplasmic adaptor subunit [Rubrivivax sp.]